MTLAALALVLLQATPAAAQTPAQQPQPAPDSAAPAAPAEGEVQLVYDREVFTYPGDGRRDPFRPLVGADGGLGPRFSELVLRGIIFSPVGTQSMVLLGDPTGRIYRLRQGDIVGNAQVLSIQPLRVIFRVEEFGAMRQEMLELTRPNTTGGQR